MRDRTTFKAGLAAAGLALVADFAGRFLLGFLSVPELLLNLLTTLIPASLFGAALVHLRYFARPLSLVSIAIALLLAGGVGGMTLARLMRMSQDRLPRWVPAALAAVVLATCGEAALLGPSGQPLTPPSAAWMLIQAGVYAAAAMWMLTASQPRGQAATGVSRRLFLEYLGLGAAVLVVGTAVLKGLRDLAAGYLASTPTGRVGPFGRIAPELTPSESFYVVSKNLLGDPELDGASWRLEVKGARTQYLSLGELTRLADLEQYQTLECISNEVGGDLISTALWRGIRLPTLLAAVGVRQTDRFVVFRAADGYSDSLPLDVAQDQSTMLGLAMNGSPLAARHGFPARLLIPGRYGMKNVKWLTSVQLTNTDIDGYWEQRGWSRAAVAKTMARFDVPGLGSIHRERPIRLGGVAYAGRRGIIRVEVGVRGTWTSAELRPPLSPFTWVIWTLDWDPPAPGRHTLHVRAVDGTGAIQSAEPSPPIPTGATGIQQIEVEVG